MIYIIELYYRDGVRVKESLIFLWKNHLKYIPILSIMFSRQYVLITPAVKYLRKLPCWKMWVRDMAPKYILEVAGHTVRKDKGE
jgi:hypothetical protein